LLDEVDEEWCGVDAEFESPKIEGWAVLVSFSWWKRSQRFALNSLVAALCIATFRVGSVSRKFTDVLASSPKCEKKHQLCDVRIQSSKFRVASVKPHIGEANK
jgi:hypothetical protein